MDNNARLVLSFAGPEPDFEIRDWIRAGYLAGVVLFSDNFVSIPKMRETVARLKEDGGPSLRIMIDEEGGRVRRLPDSISPMPSISTYGENHNAIQAARDYESICRTLAKMGIDTLLAPVVDVRTEHNLWLADRTFSAEPREVADFGRQAVQAIQGVGLAACAKHFPGLGGVHNDLHAQQFIVRDERLLIEKCDLVPFRGVIGAGVEMVMVSHAIYQAFDADRPAVFSAMVIDGLLRKHLGFSGLVLSDDLAMGAVGQSVPIEKAVELALRAGCDMVLVCRNRPLQRRAVHLLSR